MHWNRMLYDLPQYQEKLRRGYQKLGLLCENKKTGKFMVFRPVPNCPWLPESRKKYFTKLFIRSKNINFNKKYSFCTLTYSSNIYNPIQAARRVKSDLDKFFKRLNYRNSKPEYFYVIELTQKYMVHIHLIFQGYVHKKKIFKTWFKVTGCISIRIKSLPFDKAIYYCLKYLTKSKNQDESKWGFIFSHIDRLWTCSRKFFLPFIKSDPVWFIHAFFRDNHFFTYKFFSDLFENTKSRELTQYEFQNLLSDLACSDDVYFLNNKSDSYPYEVIQNIPGGVSKFNSKFSDGTEVKCYIQV